jgi:uncharacterized protein
MKAKKTVDKPLVLNQVRRTLESILGSGYLNPMAKHDLYKDFGYPGTLQFADYYKIYTRNALAHGAVNRTVAKTWESVPTLRYTPEDEEPDALEVAVEQAFRRKRLWQKLMLADTRSMVGDYAGVILQVKDSAPFNTPARGGPGGLAHLHDIIPAWQLQVRPMRFQTDPTALDYGDPLEWQFNESQVQSPNPDDQEARSLTIHPSRIVVWSHDGDIGGPSALMAGYNALIDIEKISGAGGEAFYKNARQNLILKMMEGAQIEQLAAALGVEAAGVPDKMDEVIQDWTKGFDKSLLLQSIDPQVLSVSLPLPREFFDMMVAEFAASMNIPVKILIGNQTGERASQEDAQDWAQHCMSRRARETIPNIERFVQALVRAGAMPDLDWRVEWGDLTEAGAGEKIARATQMAAINAQMLGTGEPPPFSANEIREAAGYEPEEEPEWADAFPGEGAGTQGGGGQGAAPQAPQQY